MYLYTVGTALSNSCTYRYMTEGPILIDFFYFSKIRFDPVVLKFLATPEKQNKLDQKTRVIIGGKLLENTRVKLQFAILPEYFDLSRVILFLIKDLEFKKRSAIDWTRVILDWEGGQPKLPNGPGNKTS